MNNYPKFGECLRLMLSALNIKSSSLARVLNIDTSLVNRWIHGKRVPPYRSCYIEYIAEYLSNNVLNSFQRKKLEEILKAIDGSSPDNTSLHEKVKKVLLEAQGHSIELKKSPKMDTHRVYGLLDNEIASTGESMLNHDGELKINVPQSCFIQLAAQDQIILGRKNILYTLLELLKTAARKSGSTNRTPIFITLNNSIDMFYQNQDLCRIWEQTLQDVLKKGWNIIFLLRLNNDLNRIIRIIHYFLPLLGMGRFNLYGFKKYDYDYLSMDRELIIVPGIGVLSCYPSREFSGIDCAFYLKTPPAEQILLNYVNRIMHISSCPLIKYFSSNEISEFQNEILESEKVHGSRYLYKNGLSILTLPLSLYEKYLQRNNLPAAILKDKLESHQRRLDLFYSIVANYKYTDIYTTESLQKFINDGLYPADSFYGKDHFQATPEDIAEHLSHIVRLLKKYKNYEIALVNEKHTKSQMKLYCMVKENHSVKIELWDNGFSSHQQYLSLDEPMIVKSFEEYLKEFRENIAPINRDKKELIAWLERRIKILLQ